MTLLWLQGMPIEVYSDTQARPRVFIWGGMRHQVHGISNHWRLDQEWWGERIWRHYYKLITDTGLLVIIYRDLISQHWYFERLYD
jgi:hypothetical protein